jgi:hypothetical protein
MRLQAAAYAWRAVDVFDHMDPTPRRFEDLTPAVCDCSRTGVKRPLGSMARHICLGVDISTAADPCERAPVSVPLAWDESQLARALRPLRRGYRSAGTWLNAARTVACLLDVRAAHRSPKQSGRGANRPDVAARQQQRQAQARPILADLVSYSGETRVFVCDSCVNSF